MFLRKTRQKAQIFPFINKHANSSSQQQQQRVIHDDYYKEADLNGEHCLRQHATDRKPRAVKDQAIDGVVLYDFQGEQSNELVDAKAGEAITIIAQPNVEWYVALGRLGEPGLIPVSFVDIRPYVVVVSAYIDTCVLEGDEYWFIVFAKLSNGKYRVLYRLYEDFYDFQVRFLHEYPKEVGMLPSMTRKVQTVADRARDLTRYCKQVLELPSYVSNGLLVQEGLFGLHEGDIETHIHPNSSTSSKETIKEKIIYKEDIVAIKIPVTSSFEFLKGEIVNRLGFDVYLEYHSSQGLVQFTRDIFQQAVKLGTTTKLTVVATYQ